MIHLVMFSGGIGSWMTAKRVVAAGASPEDVRLVFTDTKTEDEDLYRFLPEAAANVGAELVTLADGRDIWQIFKDERYLGNHRRDPCSKMLKRRVARRWIREQYPDPEEVMVHLGIDWTEVHRLDKARPFWAPYQVMAPMTDPPYLSRGEMLDRLVREGIQPPRLYKLGMPHNNCGGGCVKAGQGHFALLLRVWRERFLEWEAKEEEIRQFLGKDVSMLDDRRGGERTPFTLRQLRREIEEERYQPDLFEIGGCGCFIDVEDDDGQEEERGIDQGRDAAATGHQVHQEDHAGTEQG